MVLLYVHSRLACPRRQLSCRRHHHMPAMHGLGPLFCHAARACSEGYEALPGEDPGSSPAPAVAASSAAGASNSTVDGSDSKAKFEDYQEQCEKVTAEWRRRLLCCARKCSRLSVQGAISLPDHRCRGSRCKQHVYCGASRGALRNTRSLLGGVCDILLPSFSKKGKAEPWLSGSEWSWAPCAAR